MKPTLSCQCSSRIPALLPLVLFLLLFVVVPASANPPADMALSYDPAVSMLSVTITHPVAGTNGHFIRDVKLTVNGNVANDSVYTGQPSDTFTYIYPMTLKPGETVEATASCSLFGSAARTYTMQAAMAGESVTSTASLAAPQSVPQVPSPTKTPVAVATVLAGALSGLLIRKRF
jgi:hypothetical protein